MTIPTEPLQTNQLSEERLPQSVQKDEYSEQKFWGKLKKQAKKAGNKTVYTALLLYYSLRKPEVPKWAKASVLGALGYFIAPIDVISDFIPAAGYSDDLGVLLAALAIVSVYIDEGTKAKAKSKMTQWFGIVEDELKRNTDT